MIFDLLSVFGGLVLLMVSGDLLVRGAVALSQRLGIPSLIVGLTVVAFGTSAPELLVSVRAVLDHAPGIALGNVVGSNIANVFLVIGIPAMISTIHPAEGGIRRSYLTMIGASLLFIVLAFLGPLSRLHAAVLLAALAWMLWDSYRSALAHRDALDGPNEQCFTSPAIPGWRIALYVGLGLAGLPLGADLLVDGAINIARAAGVGETVIGLTLVAVGTSLPELAASVVAAFRRQAEVALGNIIGSNVFNLLGIVGIAGLVGPLPVPPHMLYFDLWVMLGSSLALAPFVLRDRVISRPAGIALTAAYVIFVIVVIV